MRLVYMGSPESALSPLHALVDAGHDVALVVTNPPRRRGRRSAPTPTPVGAAAASLGIEVSHDPADAARAGADLGVVVAFGRILSADLLRSLRMVNLHFSLLPRWRGAAPVERAILAGDDRTGVCVMEVEEGLDTGAVFDCVEMELGADSTAAGVTRRLSELGAELLVQVLAEPLGQPTPQAEEGVTYAEKISTAELRLDWDGSAEQASRTVRVGGAWTTLAGRRLKVLEAEVFDGAVPGESGHPPGEIVGDLVACAPGWLRLLRVQPEGRAAMDAAAFLNGARLDAGTRAGT